MKLITESVLFVLLLCCCVTVNARCWVECPESQRGLSEPECFLKDDGTSTSCSKSISNSDLTGQSISGFKSVLIWVKLSTRVVNLDIYNSIGDKLKVGASLYNYDLTQLHIHNGLAHFRPDLIYSLPNLKFLHLYSVDFHYLPYFSLFNQFLTYINIEYFSIRGIHSNIIRKGRVSDLSQLKHLYLYPNQFMNLTDQTFSGLTALTYLYVRQCHIPNPATTFSPLVRLSRLYYQSSELTDISFLNKTPSIYKLKSLSFSSNILTSIQSNTFSRYSYLTRLYLGNNKISRLENECFKGLDRIKNLYLDSNQLTELNSTTFKGLKSLTNINLNHNHIPHISSRIFESLPNLNVIYLNGVPLHCDCSLQWMSIVNLNIYNSLCSTPPQHSGKRATYPSIYVNCTQELSYQCFDRSNSCPTGSYCQDTFNSYTCVCEEENYLFITPLNMCISYDQLTQCHAQCSTTNP